MRTNKEPITDSGTLNDLAAKLSIDGDELAELLSPGFWFDGDDQHGAIDAVSFLSDNGVKIPQIIAIDDGSWEIVWTLLPEAKAEAALTKAIKDAEADNKEQEKQDAEVAVATLEKQLAAAKETLAAKTNKGSKSK